MAWTVLLPSGNYQGKYRDSLGKERSAGTFTQKAQALREAGAKEAEQRTPGALDPDGGKITWGGWFALWHSSRILAHATDSTYRSTADNHVLPTWGAVTLDRITQMNIQQWVKSLEKGGASPFVIRNALMLLKTSLNAAVADERLQRSPAKNVPYPPLPSGTERFLTVDEVENMTFFMNGIDACVVWTSVQTGLRFGELSGLHWPRVDFERRTIRVTDQYNLKAGAIKAVLKDKEERTVPMPADLVTMLARLRDAAEPQMQKTCGLPHLSGHCGGDLVFRGHRGAVLKANDWGKRVWHKCLDLARVEGRVRPQDMRHTYASWLLQQGVSIPELALMMGHSRWEVTQKYAHLQNSAAYDAVRNALDSTRQRVPDVEQAAHQREWERRLAAGEPMNTLTAIRAIGSSVPPLAE